MWGSHQRDTIRRISEEQWDELNWRGERLSQESRDEIKRLFREDLSDHEGAVLVWVLRNRFFFELRLQEDERVLLVKYEELVTHPDTLFPWVFEFIGIPFEPTYVSEVKATSIRKEVCPHICPEIRTVADRMMARLDEASVAQRASAPGPPD
jgi:hypothetical protein